MTLTMKSEIGLLILLKCFKTKNMIPRLCFCKVKLSLIKSLVSYIELDCSEHIDFSASPRDLEYSLQLYLESPTQEPFNVSHIVPAEEEEKKEEKHQETKVNGVASPSIGKLEQFES